MNIQDIWDMPEVSADVIAALYGTSQSMITRLTSRGVISASGKNKYELGPTIKRLFEFEKGKRGEPEEGTTKATLEQEKLMRAQIAREKEEIELELSKGELHKSKHIKLFVGTMISTAKTKLSAMPSKLAPQLIGLSKFEIRSAIAADVYCIQKSEQLTDFLVIIYRLYETTHLMIALCKMSRWVCNHTLPLFQSS